MNKNKLRAMMALCGDTDGVLAEFIGINRGTFSKKLNETNGGEFTQSEISKIKQRYNLTAEEVDEIFFAKGVSKLDTGRGANAG